ncbi:hypothetical protein BC939DRAFT_264344 [Gamsiella multidivaricata]|uniref:uncharacterized protein n=1 Tax=Gamsiella multidivaricata TaxID=101098 RepID=UPI00222061B2|nr:uncharacterized protein BC939DRAFT_264344 [Gamsiella multidivaricata]KAG0369825.1 hypothetical protein BGZ54_008723 [Gamsiella multidivaricata]KAI7819426.1 hypothetical protein BC939DRAFT_264344 [Gamsiella multidivaricata]
MHDGKIDTKNEQLGFLFSLFVCIYNSKLPSNLESGSHVLRFIEKAKKFLPAITKDGTKMSYSGPTVLRSTATQLSVELKNHYCNGSKDLCEKIKACMTKGLLLSADALGSIDHGISAIENFIPLDRVCMSGRRLAPLTPFEDIFVSLSELELTKIFWQGVALRKLLQNYAKPDFPSTENIARVDVSYWPSKMTP